ncbi:hypothetical protein F4777DRAFT_281916 [Nemania sp. FL0916]|nr:hypothetical protein F4777DRAFT_281916 [Nemania sp. FL0916]
MQLPVGGSALLYRNTLSALHMSLTLCLAYIGTYIAACFTTRTYIGRCMVMGYWRRQSEALRPRVDISLQSTCYVLLHVSCGILRLCSYIVSEPGISRHYCANDSEGHR